MKSANGRDVGGSKKVLIEFGGPFQWLDPTNPDYLFNASVASKSGLYFWSVMTQEVELVYYVGETGRSFAKRHEEHLLAYIGGLYRFYDAVALRRGDKYLLWPGMWQGERIARAEKYIADLPTLAPQLGAFLRVLRLYVAPIETEPRVRKRVEAGLADAFYRLGDGRHLQDNDIRYNRRQLGEDEMVVQVSCSAAILGWPSSLAV